MTTSFDSIYDQFLMFAKDYRLNSLYSTSVTDFTTYLSGWLIPAITDFVRCDQSLAYTGTTFTVTLTQKNIKILALMMKRYWLKQEIENITQMSLHVQDRDFKTFAEANNLKAKQDAYILDLEEVSQMIVDYGFEYSVDWDAWENGVYRV